MKLACVFFIAFLSVAFAQFQEKCVTPSRWEGSFREIDFESRTGRFGNISYDAGLEAITVTEIEREPGDIRRTVKYHEVFLFKQEKSYRLDMDTNTCEERQLTDSFRPFGVPYESAYEGTNYIGGMTTGLGVKVDEYFLRRDGDYASSFAPLGSSTCIPVLESFIRYSNGPAPSRSTNSHIQFLNIKPVTVFPPSTFEKPPQCS